MWVQTSGSLSIYFEVGLLIGASVGSLVGTRGLLGSLVGSDIRILVGLRLGVLVVAPVGWFAR